MGRHRLLGASRHAGQRQVSLGRWGAAALAAGALSVWWALGTEPNLLAEIAHEPPTASSSKPTAGLTLPAFAQDTALGFTRPKPGAETVALWRSQLVRAQSTLASYREATRYPFTARPLSEQPDQAFPYQPVVEERPFRLPQGTVVPGLNLRTTQDRVHIQAQESVTVTVEALDEQGKTLPLSIQRAWAHEGGRGQQASHPHLADVQFRDDGEGADKQAGDGVHSAAISPARLGFGDLAGTLRLEVSMLAQAGASEQPGYAYFDVVTHPEQAATWLPGARDRLAQGSLWFELPLQVNTAGRYVATGRVDDANGKPYALLSFNDELGVGKQLIRLQLFGKLVRDLKPKFPLRLRDVQAFRLIPDAFPDRAMLPAAGSPDLVSGLHPYLAFSDAEWQSEERSRYLAEYSKDVDEAQEQLRHLIESSP